MSYRIEKECSKIMKKSSKIDEGALKIPEMEVEH